jgi:tRNA1Val (adenine37-N6)-methyltransferase
MANPYFRFQQFTVFQDRCAMKVGTDGVLLGAWVSVQGAQRILDIGTGTGLIALMLAQRSQGQTPPVRIDAVELDAEACRQAQNNVRRSPWPDRIQVHPGSIQAYATACSDRYDLLVSNPPFFANVSKAQSPARTLARHNDTLPTGDLLQIAVQLLRERGRLAVIYPPAVAQPFQAQAEAWGLFCHRKLYVKSTPESPIKRILLELSATAAGCQEASLTLETARHVYTPEFMALVKDFYLRAGGQKG